MNSKNERLEYGNAAEEKFNKFLIENKINFIHNKVDNKKVTAYDNMRYGDFFIKNKLGWYEVKVDVKRSYKIFEDSIDNFEGDYYILIPDDLSIENGWVIRRETIQAYWKRMKKDNSEYICKKWDDEEKKYVKYMNVNNTLRKKTTIKEWLKKEF